MMIARILKRTGREQLGITATELVVTSALLLIVTTAFISLTEGLSRSLARQDEQTRANDEARLAVEHLDREIRSGNVLYDPAGETPANYSLRIYTQTNATTRTPGFQCVQWRLEEGELIRRSWPPGRPEEVTAWRTVAQHIVNVALGVPAFTLDPDPSKAGRTIDITVMVDPDPADATTRPVRIETSLTGRNTMFDFPVQVCSDVPVG